MGWYLRKAFSFGPLRLNVSRSGLGYSVGVKGLRLGSGPRGNYVHMGRYGVYYRQSLSPHPSPDRIPSLPPQDVPPQGTVIPTADASRLTDSSADHMLAYIREQHAKLSVAPWATVFAGLLLLIMIGAEIVAWVTATAAVGAVVAYFVLRAYDSERKRVLLSYRLDETSRSRYEALSSSFQALGSAQRLWRIVTRDASLDPKYHAGAGYLINRKPAGTRKSPPPHLQVNVDIWRLGLGDQMLYFFPDRILVYQGSQIGAVPYSTFSASSNTTRFIETDSVPGDARVVDRTWRYTNKRGGPDRRFANNSEIPVAEYAQIGLSSQGGLNVVMHASSVDAAGRFVAGVNQYCSDVASAATAEPVEQPATSDEHDSESSAPAIAQFGWAAAPVLLAGMVIGIWLGPRDVQPPPHLPTPAPELALPQFRILKQKGAQLIISVPSGTSDAELLRLLSDFREKIRSQRLNDIGIHSPAQKGKAAPKALSTGTILVFRGALSVPRNLTKSDAVIKWGARGQVGTLRKADGTRVPAWGANASRG